MNIDEYMTECDGKPFKWGSFDCCLFAAGAIEVTTGIDCMAGLKTYKDETSGSVVLREHFGTVKVREIFLQIAEKMNARKVTLSEARNGDVVCIEWPKRIMGKGQIDQTCGLGVFYRNKAFACLQPRGIIQVPVVHRIIDVWRFE